MRSVVVALLIGIASPALAQDDEQGRIALAEAKLNACLGTVSMLSIEDMVKPDAMTTRRRTR